MNLLAAQLTHAQLDYLVVNLLRVIESVPAVKTLLLMIFLDMFLGLMVAFIRKALSSTISFRGVTRKITELLLVAFGAVLEPYAQGLPVAQMVAIFYVVTEGMSILENAATLGVPLPTFLSETLVKLREGQKARIETKIPGGTDVQQNTAAILDNTAARKGQLQTLPIPVEIVNQPEHPVPTTNIQS